MLSQRRGFGITSSSCTTILVVLVDGIWIDQLQVDVPFEEPLVRVILQQVVDPLL